MDIYSRDIFVGIFHWLIDSIYFWLCPPTSFNFGQSIEKQVRKCLECGQPIEAQKYYIIERYNAVLMLPQEWDTNEELTGQATMELQSNTPVTITSSTLDKPVCSIETITPLCCHPTMEQAELLLCFTRLALKRRNIPCFIVPLEKDQLSLDKSLVSRCGSLIIDKFFLGEEELIETEYSLDLEGIISRIFKIFDGDKDVTFSSTRLRKRTIYD